MNEKEVLKEIKEIIDVYEESKEKLNEVKEAIADCETETESFDVADDVRDEVIDFYRAVTSFFNGKFLPLINSLNKVYRFYGMISYDVYLDENTKVRLYPSEPEIIYKDWYIFEFDDEKIDNYIQEHEPEILLKDIEVKIELLEKYDEIKNQIYSFKDIQEKMRDLKNRFEEIEREDF